MADDAQTTGPREDRADEREREERAQDALRARIPLVDGMAAHGGADIAEGFRQGAMTPRLYRDCLTRCADCRDAKACERLLAEERYGDAPDYCRNKVELAAFAERLRRALD